MDAKGIEAVSDPNFMTDAMQTTNKDFATQCIEKATEFAVTNNRKPTKAELYQIFIDAFMEN